MRVRPSTFAVARPDRATVTVTARARGRALEVGILLVLAVAYLWFALAVRGAHSFTGDEPHYLVTTQGFWLYHTYDQHRVLYHHDFYTYYQPPPHGRISSYSLHRGERLYPLHSPGLPLVTLPGFALAGATGAQVTMVVIALLVCWRAFRLSARLAGPVPAALAVGILGLSAPFVLNAGAIYPDLLSGLLLLLAYEAIDVPRLTIRRALALGLLLGFAPWLHIKLLAVVAVFMTWIAWLLWRQRRAFPFRPMANRPLDRAQRSGASLPTPTRSPTGRGAPTSFPAVSGREWGGIRAPVRPHMQRGGTNPTRALPGSAGVSPARVPVHAGRDGRPLGQGARVRAPALLALGLPLLSIAALSLFNLVYYGTPNLIAPYTLRGQTFLAGYLLSGAAGEFFAQGPGALGAAPFALLLIPGAVALWRRDRAVALKIGLATLPFWLVTLGYRWWGGDCPPMRYLLAVVPLWTPAIAALLAGLRTAGARLAVTAFAAITVALTLVIPLAARYGWPIDDGQGALPAALGNALRLPLTAWLPRFVITAGDNGHWQHAVAILPWAGGLSILWLVLAWRERQAARHAAPAYWAPG